MGFLEVISRRLLLEIRRRRFRAPAATCYDSKRNLLSRSFLGLKLFFRSVPPIFILRKCFLRFVLCKDKLDIGKDKLDIYCALKRLFKTKIFFYQQVSNKSYFSFLLK